MELMNFLVGAMVGSMAVLAMTIYRDCTSVVVEDVFAGDRIQYVGAGRWRRAR